MYKRILILDSILEDQSVFLLGPRQTGKSTFLKTKYPEAHTVDLLDSSYFRSLLSRPKSFYEEVLFRSKKQSLFIVDEIQKAPQLLDEVHRLIEKNKKLRFILTGSSARKLRKEGVNLLGGRASKVLFHPLVFPEFATDFKFHSNFLSQLENGKPIIYKQNVESKAAKNVLMIPLTILNQVIGVIGLEQDNPNHIWTEEDVAIAQAAANRAALTLENARLLEESQRRAAKERAILEATSRIGAALSIENILQAAAEELERVVGSSEIVLQFNNNASTANDSKDDM